jgi:hypothetical protein
MITFKKTTPRSSSSFSEKEKNGALENLQLKLNAMELTIAQLEGVQSAMPDPYYVRDMDYNIVIWPESKNRKLTV